MEKAMIRIVFCILLLISVEASAEGGYYASPSLALKNIEKLGAKQALREVYDSAAWMIWIIPGISSGDPEWLRVGGAFRGASDAAGYEELDRAYSIALVRKPYDLLPILKEQWWQNSTACKFGWDSELLGGVPGYLDELKASLQRPGSTKLKSLRAECLKGIEKSYEEFNQEKPVMR